MNVLRIGLMNGDQQPLTLDVMCDLVCAYFERKCGFPNLRDWLCDKDERTKAFGIEHVKDVLDMDQPQFRDATYVLIRGYIENPNPAVATARIQIMYTNEGAGTMDFSDRGDFSSRLATILPPRKNSAYYQRLLKDLHDQLDGLLKRIDSA